MILPFFIAGVRRFLPYNVREYQYCISHHAGDIKSVTERPFIGGVLNRSRGDLLSGSLGSKGATSVLAFGGMGESSKTYDLTRRFSVSQIHSKQ